MRIFTAYLLLIAFLLAQQGLVQLAKLPVLLEHYQEHKALDEQLSVWEYLSMHYFDDSHHSDFARDQQLPFKSMTMATAFLFTAIIPKEEKLPLLPSIFYNYQERMPMRNEKGSSSYLDAIFQPPRLAAS